MFESHGWKPRQKWRVRVACFSGVEREFRTYVRPSRDEALLLADDLNRTGYWDSIMVEERDVMTRPRKPKKGPVESPRADRARKKKAARLSAAARTVDMFIPPADLCGEPDSYGYPCFLAKNHYPAPHTSNMQKFR